MTFVADDAALATGDGGFPAIVSVTTGNWERQKPSRRPEDDDRV
jgi:hypothetical protein